jgi:hypothetical protein
MHGLRSTLIALGAMLAGSDALAQETPLHWVCFAEVNVSQSVGMRMTLLGPALRRNVVHNIYFAEFTTPSSQRVHKDGYAARYAAALRQTGYSGIEDASCAPFESVAGAEAQKAWLREPTTGGGGSIRVTFNTIPVIWTPDTSQPASKEAKENVMTN